MTKHRRILNIIERIRSSHSEMENIFLHGSCLNFHLILRSIFPESEPWFNIDHIITKIDGKFYDISGCVIGSGYLQYYKIYNKKRTSRSFSQMYLYEYEIKSTSKNPSKRVAKGINDVQLTAHMVRLWSKGGTTTTGDELCASLDIV